MLEYLGEIILFFTGMTIGATLMHTWHIYEENEAERERLKRRQALIDLMCEQHKP